jgi:hypothetical protein
MPRPRKKPNPTYPRFEKLPKGFVLERALGRLRENVTTGYEVWTDAQLSKRAHDLAYELRLVDEEMVRRAEKLEKRE